MEWWGRREELSLLKVSGTFIDQRDPLWPFLGHRDRHPNSQCVGGDGVFVRKMQNTVLACVVFWCSGILGWRPEKRGFERRKAGDRLKEK
jgi:hypothetical protein